MQPGGGTISSVNMQILQFNPKTTHECSTHQVLEILESLLGRFTFARLALGRRQVLVVVLAIRWLLLTHALTQANAAGVLTLGTVGGRTDALVRARRLTSVTLLLITALDSLLALGLLGGFLVVVAILIAVFVVVCNWKEKKRKRGMDSMGRERTQCQNE